MVVSSFGMYWSPTRAAAPPLRPPAAQHAAAAAPPSPAQEIIRRADRRAREAERWWAEGASAAVDVRRKRLEQWQVAGRAQQNAAGMDAITGHENRAQEAGMSQVRALVEAEKRVEEAKVAAVAAVLAVRQETLSQIAQITETSEQQRSRAQRQLYAPPPQQQQPYPNQPYTPPPPPPPPAETLHHAVASASVIAVVRSLDNGQLVDGLDGRGRTALWLAASKGFATVIAVLAEHGADVNLPCGGMTPCYAAAGSGQTDALRTLAQLGADIERPDAHQITPVSIAAHQGHLAEVRMLADLGANLERTSENGATPFWSACHAGNLKVATFLASRGVDIWRSAKQRTPREIARLEGHMAIVRLIDSHSDRQESKPPGNSRVAVVVAPGHPSTTARNAQRIETAHHAWRQSVGEPDTVDSRTLVTDHSAAVNQVVSKEAFVEACTHFLTQGEPRQPGAMGTEAEQPLAALAASISMGEDQSTAISAGAAAAAAAASLATHDSARNADISLPRGQGIEITTGVDSHQQTKTPRHAASFDQQSAVDSKRDRESAPGPTDESTREKVASDVDNELQLTVPAGLAHSVASNPMPSTPEQDAGSHTCENEATANAVNDVRNNSVSTRVYRRPTMGQGDTVVANITLRSSVPKLTCLPAEVCRSTSIMKHLVCEIDERCSGLQGVPKCIEELGKLVDGNAVAASHERSVAKELRSCNHPMEAVAFSLLKIDENLRFAESRCLQRVSDIGAEVADLNHQLAAAQRYSHAEEVPAVATEQCGAAQENVIRNRLQKKLDAAVAAAEARAATLMAGQERSIQESANEEQQVASETQWQTAEYEATNECNGAESNAAAATLAAHAAGVASNQAAEELEQLQQAVLATDQDRLSRQNQMEALERSSVTEKQLVKELDVANRSVQEGHVRVGCVQNKATASLEAAEAQKQRLHQLGKNADAVLEKKSLARAQVFSERSEVLLSLRTDARRSMTVDAAAEGQSLRAEANAAGERLRKAEVKLQHSKIEQSSQQAKLEAEEKSSERAARAAGNVQHPLLGTNQRLTAARDSLERHERARAAAQNEAQAADEELVMLRSELERILRKTEQLYCERREATDAVQTIAAKFEQVGAELELSYDDAGAKPEARRQELARLRKQQADNQDYVLEMEEELAELQTQNDQLRRKAASIERELAESGQRPTTKTTPVQPRSKSSASPKPGDRRLAQPKHAIEGDPNARPRPRKEQTQPAQTADGAGFEDVLTVGSRFRGSVDQGGRKLMYNLKVTRVGTQAGHLVGQQTLLTATNVITVHALPGIPNLIRIAEKSKGGLEAVGEVDAARGMIEGMITIAGEECPFVLSKVE